LDENINVGPVGGDDMNGNQQEEQQRPVVQE
jgi:hypothetical protein